MTKPVQVDSFRENWLFDETIKNSASVTWWRCRSGTEIVSRIIWTGRVVELDKNINMTTRWGQAPRRVQLVEWKVNFLRSLVKVRCITRAPWISYHARCQHRKHDEHARSSIYFYRSFQKSFRLFLPNYSSRCSLNIALCTISRLLLVSFMETYGSCFRALFLSLLLEPRPKAREKRLLRRPQMGWSEARRFDVQINAHAPNSLKNWRN